MNKKIKHKSGNSHKGTPSPSIYEGEGYKAIRFMLERQFAIRRHTEERIKGNLPEYKS